MTRWTPASAPAAVLAAVLGAAGCLSTASYHTAEPLAVGETEMGIAAELDTVVGDEDSDEVVVTQPRVYVRRGLRDNLDLGLTAGTFGSAVDANVSIVTGDAYTVSINPYQGLALSRAFGGDTGDFAPQSDLRSTTMLGVLADWRLADRVTLTGGLKPGLVLDSTDEPTGRETESELFVAGSLGAKLELSGGAHIFPELNLVRGVTNRSEAWPDGTIVKFGVGFGF